MQVVCPKCNRVYDDANRWTMCPHTPLECAVDDLCPECDTLKSVHGPCQHQIAGKAEPAIDRVAPVEMSRRVMDAGVVEVTQAIPSRVGKDNRHPEGYDVVRWPEFIAFAKRLGINLALPFRGLSISIPFEGECVEITQTYIADDINQPEAKTPFDDMVRPLDVTTAHNEHYRTYVGKPDNDQPDRAPDEIWGSLNFTNLNIGDSWVKFLDTDGVMRFRIFRAKKPN